MTHFPSRYFQVPDTYIHTGSNLYIRTQVPAHNLECLAALRLPVNLSIELLSAFVFAFLPSFSQPRAGESPPAMSVKPTEWAQSPPPSALAIRPENCPKKSHPSTP
jgi:hypothetical protein